MLFAFLNPTDEWHYIDHAQDLPSSDNKLLHMHRVYDSGEFVSRLRLTRLTIWLSPSPNKISILNPDFGAQYRACISLCQRLTIILTNNRPWLEASVDRYSFPSNGLSPSMSICRQLRLAHWVSSYFLETRSGQSL